MTTSAGRLSSRMSQGSPSRLARGARPIRYPIAVPKVIASVKAKATRANVTPRLRNRAPERASAIIAASTAGGGGNLSGPASNAAAHQVARNKANDRRRTISVRPRDRMIESTGIEFLRRPNDVRTAYCGQNAKEDAGIGLRSEERRVGKE